MQNQSNRNKHVKKRPKSVKITITLPQGLLDLADKAAEEDFTNRSDIIRAALLWYLRPQGRDIQQTDPDRILKTLEQRKSRVKINRMFKDLGID